jgi:glutamyl-tRNA reductase
VTSTPPPTIAALIAHARSVPAGARGTFTEACRARLAGRGALLLDTCHRVEAYLVVDGELPSPEHWLPEGGRLLVGQDSVRHAISVAVGLDSVVVGEDQVLHQLRNAIGQARDGGGLDPVLERLFTHALRAGRRARSWRQGRAPSVADLAVTVVERRIGPLDGRPMLVVGAGQIGRLAARAARAAGADVSIASRTSERARSAAARLGVKAAAFDPGAIVAGMSGIVVALRGPWSVPASTAHAIVAGEAVVVDLSVPAALEPGLAAALGDRHVSADALVRIAEAAATAPDDALVDRLRRLVDSTAGEFNDWLATHDGRAAARALAELAETERAAELVELWRRLPRIDPETKGAIEGMSRHLAARLLRGPLERLGRDHDGRHERAARELFGL